MKSLSVKKSECRSSVGAGYWTREQWQRKLERVMGEAGGRWYEHESSSPNQVVDVEYHASSLHGAEFNYLPVTVWVEIFPNPNSPLRKSDTGFVDSWLTKITLGVVESENHPLYQRSLRELGLNASDYV